MKHTKMGRPTKSVKDIIIKVRIDRETEEQLELCMKYANKSKSEIVRNGIFKMYNEIKGVDDK